MSTSDIEKRRYYFFKSGLVYLIITIFCMMFGAVYEHYSHEVYSYYMIYAFAFPLILGSFSSFILFFRKQTKFPERLSVNLYNAGVGTLTVGSITLGVLEIYGTANKLTNLYWVVGILFVISGIAVYYIKDLLLKEKY